MSDAPSLGRDVAARFTPPHARRLARVAPERRAGMVAAKAARFGLLNGRSILARRMMGERVVARVSGTDLLPVGMPPDLFFAVAEQERSRLRPAPTAMEQMLHASHTRAIQRLMPRGSFAAQAASLGPRGLPRATSRGRLSPAGADTGPSAAAHRMISEAAFVANPDEVRAAGPMLGRRDQTRAVARRSAAGPPSPSTGGGRARRTAQASGPGRQVGPTRPTTPVPFVGTEPSAGAPPTNDRGAAAPTSDRAGARQSFIADSPSVLARHPLPGPGAVAPPSFVADAPGVVARHSWPGPGAVARRGALAAALRSTPASGAWRRASAVPPMATSAISTISRTAASATVLPMSPASSGASVLQSVPASPMLTALQGAGTHGAGTQGVGTHGVGTHGVGAPATLFGPAAPAPLPVARALQVARAHHVVPTLTDGADVGSRSASRTVAARSWASAPAPSVPTIASTASILRRAFEPSVAGTSWSAGGENAAPTNAFGRVTAARLAPPLPLAAAFAPRAGVDDTRPMLPLVARASAVAAAQAVPRGRVTTTVAPLPTRVRATASTTAASVATSPAVTTTALATTSTATPPPVLRRSRFGEAIAPTIGSPIAPIAAVADARASMFGRPLAFEGRGRLADAPSILAPRPTSVDGVARPPSGIAGDVVRRAAAAPADAASPMAPPHPVVAPVPGVAPTSAAARFVTAMNERPADPIRPVPSLFAPLARAIAGPKPVAVRTGPSTTRALQRAGKQAVTVDNVVHLARAPEASPPSVEVFAHELVHAARPSPVPRFFDDDHHSPEEDLARATGQLVRAVQAPTEARPPAGRTATAGDARVPTFGTAGLTVGAGGGLMSALTGAAGAHAAPSPRSATSSSSTSSSTVRRAADDVIRRSPAKRAAERRSPRERESSGSSASGGGSAAAAAAAGSASGGMVIRRSLNTAASSGPASSIFPSGTVIRRLNDSSGPSSTSASSSAVDAALASMLKGGVGELGSGVQPSTAPIRNELIAQIVDAIEERVIAELERRGRRHNPGVF